MAAATLHAHWPIVQIDNGDIGILYCEVPDWPGYAVGCDGSVWTRRKICNKPGQMLDTWRRMKPGLRRGYESVLLSHPPRRKTHRVHHLVLLAFVDARPDGAVSRHLDGNKRNNWHWNLLWGTQAENCRDNVNQGTIARGESLNLGVLTIELVKEIRRLKSGGLGCVRIARQLKLKERTVSSVLERRTWAWLE